MRLFIANVCALLVGLYAAGAVPHWTGIIAAFAWGFVCGEMKERERAA